MIEKYETFKYSIDNNLMKIQLRIYKFTRDLKLN